MTNASASRGDPTPVGPKIVPTMPRSDQSLILSSPKVCSHGKLALVRNDHADGTGRMFRQDAGLEWSTGPSAANGLQILRLYVHANFIQGVQHQGAEIVLLVLAQPLLNALHH